MDFVCYDKNIKIFSANEVIDKIIILLEGIIIKKNKSVFADETIILGEECLILDEPYHNPNDDLYIGSEKAVIGEVYKS